MAAEVVSERRMMIRGIVGWTLIVLAVGGGLWFWSAIRSADPERRLAGRWVFDEQAEWNAGKPGGYQIEFADRTVRVFDPAGAQIHSQPWSTFKYGSTDGEFPTSLMLMKTSSEADGFAHVALSRDETRMRFLIAGDGPSRANEFRRAK